MAFTTALSTTAIPLDAPGVTDLLADWAQGDQEAGAKVLPAVYGELRRLASQQLSQERRRVTLETHDLIHEAFLRLIDQHRVEWQSRGHFFAIAAQMMRRVVIDNARRRAYGKRGGNVRRVALDELPDLSPQRGPDLLALDAALDELQAVDPELSRIVELRFFGGFKHAEIAELYGQSKTTVRRRWRLAKAWLHRNLNGEVADGA
ncbi:MAG: ECF-type sigma factor [Thermoanaerobaculia bacterium]